jgi:hypothetical protein
MSSNAIKVVAAIAAVAFSATVVHAGDSCGGGCPKLPKNARSVSTPGPAPLPLFPAALLVATLARGKKKTMLNVEAMITTATFLPGAPVSPAMFVDVNGISMEPSSAGPAFAAITDCASVDGGGDAPARFSCTLSGSWWIDIDANPGLIGVPLVVTLDGGGFFAPAPVALATMTVRMTKK